MKLQLLYRPIYRNLKHVWISAFNSNSGVLGQQSEMMDVLHLILYTPGLVAERGHVMTGQVSTVINISMCRKQIAHYRTWVSAPEASLALNTQQNSNDGVDFTESIWARVLILWKWIFFQKGKETKHEEKLQTTNCMKQQNTLVSYMLHWVVLKKKHDESFTKTTQAVNNVRIM